VLAPSNSEISIERMHGGGFNRIIGVSITNSKIPTVNQYVLRVPRFEVAQLDRDLAPLQLLRQRSKIKIPDIVAFDTTRRNALESPYMIQTRIPGSSLFPAYPDMSHEMRSAIAKELGEFFSELHSIRSVAAGRLTLSSSQGSLYEDGPAAQTTSDMLRTILEHKKELAIAEGPNQLFRVSFFDSFITMASEMRDLGVLDGNYYCLCHLDLEPRNILVSPPSPTQPQAITGILDWDSALFPPPFMSCSPPMWLWAWNDEDEEDERLANNTPPIPELRELKQLFEHAAGPTYRRFAYGAQYRLARKLLRFAIDGLQSNEDLIGAELLLAEWVEVYRSLKLAKAAIAAP
jgi:aminoglycoside phosphotransferase (APT) family kinase protein